MPVTEVKQALGSWQISLRSSAPRELLDALIYLGHIVVVDGRLNPKEYGDNLLSSARYVGVYRSRTNNVDNRTHDLGGSYQLRGAGLAYWLGDENDKGPVIESAITITGQTFANSIRALLSAAITEGTLNSVAGTYTGRHQWQTRRKALDYVCEIFGAEWRTRNNGTLDAGTIAQLYTTTPRAMLVKHGSGRDLSLTAYRGKIDSGEDVEDYTSKVVVLAQGQGTSIATGSATAVSVPYKDLHGNAVAITKLISESTTSNVNASARAQIELNALAAPRRAIRLAADDYDVSGTLAVGEYVWVYDPDTGLYNISNEIEFRGTRLNPAKYRCVEMTWPVVAGMTVAYRDPDGVWWDLTDHVKWESRADVSITIGELPRSLTGAGVEQVGTRPSEDTSTPATPTWNTPFFTSSYLDGLGQTRAQVLLAWNTPLNSDGSTVLDGDHYEIRMGPNPATDWQTVYAAWGSTSMLIQDLSPGVSYDIGIRAVDRNGHVSGWSVTEQITVAPDAIAPSTPAAPVVAGSRIAIQVEHELGVAAGGTFNLEVDLDHLEIHVGASSGFTPDSTTLKGKLPANVGMMLALVAAVGSFPVEETTLRYVKVIAVDASGNKSTASTAATATALLIDDAHISDLTVSKVTAGTVSANWLLAASIRTAVSGARVELNSGGFGAWNSGGIQTVAIAGADGSFILRSNSSGARIDLSSGSGLQLFNSSGVNTASLSPAGVFTFQTNSSGSRVVLNASGIQAYNAGGAQTVDIAAATGNVTVQGEVRSAASGKRLVFNPLGSTDPEIRFYPTSGTNYARIYGSSGGTDATVALESYPSGSNYGRVKVEPGNVEISVGSSFGLFQGAYALFQSSILKIGWSQATHEDNEFWLSDDSTSHKGRWTTLNDGNCGIAVGSPTVAGSSGTITYGPSVKTLRPFITPKAGNAVGHAVTSYGNSGFSWVVSTALSGFDQLFYWAVWM